MSVRALKTIWNMAQRVRARLYSNVRLRFFVRRGGALVNERSIPGYSCLMVSSPKELKEFSGSSNETLLRISKELKRRARVVVIVDQARNIVHFSCFTEENFWIGEIRRYASFSAGSVYIYNCFTDRQHRGKGLFPCALESIAQNICASRFYICARDDNLASIRAILRSGFNEVGSLRVQERYFFYESVDCTVPEIRLWK